MNGDKQQIIDLETRFWQSMKDQDVEGAQALVAQESLVTGPHGTMRADPAKFGHLMREAPWTLDNFSMSDVDVIFPSNDVAVITYKVHETGQMEGKPMDMVAADSTVWARNGDDWKVALHTETIVEDRNALQREPT